MLHSDQSGIQRTSSPSPSARQRVATSDQPRRLIRGRVQHQPTRSGFTLLEVMIATAVTLLMMLALAQIFKVIGDSMRQGRAVLELNNRLRSVVYRVRTDLDNLTAIPTPPMDPATATGYLQIFDGSLTDYSTAQISSLYSRFGDVDDILMATVRSGDVWFTGKVPAYILAQQPPASAADLQPVSIASQHAEIAFFTQPYVPDINAPGHLANSAIGAVEFQDTDSLTGYPDSFRLHYRALLIRPDLNVRTNGLNYDYLPGGAIGGVNWTLCSPAIYPKDITGADIVLPSPLCDMSSVHQQCDLSVRRVYDPSTLPAGVDYVAANSLEDLMDPANRFAHVQVPIPSRLSTTMPLLALGVSFGINEPIVDLVTSTSSTNPYGDPLGTFGLAQPNLNNFSVGSGLLHPAFVLRGDRTGEDLLASDILAFDLKVFDPGVPLLGTAGIDGVYGTSIDDDQDGNMNGANELGWAGSDDLVLSPNDPAYAAALLPPPGTSQPTLVVGTGEYVDLAWARKLATHSGGGLTQNMNLWSEFSGLSQREFGLAGPTAFTDALFSSGYVAREGLVLKVLQPSYDTWTSRYEGDGVLQAHLNVGRPGTSRVDGAMTLYGMTGTSDLANVFPPWRRSNIDAATDGIDNNPPPLDARGLGVDDATEFETSPPYPTPLRGLKVSVRMEDPLSRQVKQMSAAKEFVSQ